MAVTVESTGTAQSTSSQVNTFDYTGLTVGSGSNRAIVITCVLDRPNGFQTSPAATWDQGGTNQACDLIKHDQDNNGSGVVLMFGLVAPTAGNKTLRVTWSGASGASQICVNGLSLENVDQTGGTTTFANSGVGKGNSATASLAIASAVGNLTVADSESRLQTQSSPTQTEFMNVDNTNSNGYASQAVGAASVTHQWTVGGGGDQWCVAGTDVVAAAGGGGGGTRIGVAA